MQNFDLCNCSYENEQLPWWEFLRRCKRNGFCISRWSTFYAERISFSGSLCGNFYSVHISSLRAFCLHSETTVFASRWFWNEGFACQGFILRAKVSLYSLQQTKQAVRLSIWQIKFQHCQDIFQSMLFLRRRRGIISGKKKQNLSLSPGAISCRYCTCCRQRWNEPINYNCQFCLSAVLSTPV